MLIKPPINKDISSEILCEWVVKGMLEKKALGIVVMDLRKINYAVSDYFIICSGNSTTQIDAISDAIEKQVYKQSKENPLNREGQESKEWILLDYVDVVAHIFNDEKRMFYGLEKLWGDAEITSIKDEQ